MIHAQDIAASPRAKSDLNEAKDGQIWSIGEDLTERLKSKLSTSALSPDFDLLTGVNEGLEGVGLATADSGGKLSFLGRIRSWDLAQFGVDVNLWQPNNGGGGFPLDVSCGHEVEHPSRHVRTTEGCRRVLRKSAPTSGAYGLTAEKLCAKRRGLIHAKIVLHGETGRWSNREGFDEIAGAVTGLFEPDHPKLPHYCRMRLHRGLACHGWYHDGVSPTCHRGR
jgi:hypothetical protein